MVTLIVYASEKHSKKNFSNAKRNADLLKGFYLMDFFFF